MSQGHTIFKHFFVILCVLILTCGWKKHVSYKWENSNLILGVTSILGPL